MADTHPPSYHPNKIDVCKDERRLLFACRVLLQRKIQDRLRVLCERVLSGEAPQTYEVVLVIDNEYCSIVQQRKRGGAV